VVRLVVHYQKQSEQNQSGTTFNQKIQIMIDKIIFEFSGTVTTKGANQKIASKIDEQDVANPKDSPPPPIRITLASLEEYNILLQNGLDFYGATFFPTEATLPNATAARILTKKGR
jgi:hypothetical protein